MKNFYTPFILAIIGGFFTLIINGEVDGTLVTNVSLGAILGLLINKMDSERKNK
ncbi:hypothetical protein [Shouchella lehensis]|uniref:hypothetical protein n=1 Tax=Shouchella lehensis TaxID=300825 RepID=UPI001419B0FE|nr:hypothetical protein [Shouchella lehensis]